MHLSPGTAYPAQEMTKQLVQRGKHRFEADFLGRNHQRSGGVIGGTEFFSHQLLFRWNRFNGDHRLIDVSRPFEHHSGYQDFFSEASPKLVEPLKHIPDYHLLLP